jgi:pantetheine-phosphate adenylyltransferase
MTVAIYPGSFDPITNGHLDVIQRGAKVFSHLVVAVADSPAKETLFKKSERVTMIQEVTQDIPNIEVEGFDSLIVDFVKKKNAKVIMRGIRTVSDFEYEYQMALTNRTFASEIETVFIMTHEEFSFVSSRIIKEASALGGDVSSFVPKQVEKWLQRKFPKK